ncbi:AVAST type 4 anti-phage nuclease Avs4 [Geobacillus sp. E263]|uniref:AVAST type 4 anti-phage nuclease Avs4 n=1 Tax=Geobacillus sp. E263 TaxID=391290 RepID=UPI00117B3793|nr:AVAST type 4 anti-phage nuclease Avs4 [Geobacillus sp. E263]
MIRPDWNVFKAKFSDNPQDSFEWFCYLLFCREFNKPLGIFRYKNQAGIETDPITINDEVIGWQAKFYETTLSDHKNDLIETLTKSKERYPELSKIIFYSNQEWGQGREQNDPLPKLEIEKKAKELMIKIEWRTASFFESPFVTMDNEKLAQHFFKLGKSIIDLIEEKRTHSKSILSHINTEIAFEKEKIEIDRTEIIKYILAEIKQNQLLILTGAAGVGKTAVIKKIYKEIEENNIPIYVFKASEFELVDINNLFGNFTLQDFLNTHKDESIKIIVIDSAEKLLDLKNTEPFKEFLHNIMTNNWKLILTARSSYMLDLELQFLDFYQIKPTKILIDNLSNEELTNIAQKYNFQLPVDLKLLDLITNPFYLNEYLKFYKKDERVGYLNFKEILWQKIIKKSSPFREQCFLQIALQRANEGQFFVTPNLSESTLNSLVTDGILGYETAGYFITHDIYEEWALEKIIETEFIKRNDNKDFFYNIGESLPIRRSFRQWVSEKLQLKDDSILTFIEEVIGDEEIESFWRDEILVSILLSDYSEVFFDLFEETILENNAQLLKKISFLLRIACKEVDKDLLRQLGVKDNELLSLNLILTKPMGKGWEVLINFVYQNFEKLKDQSNLDYILPIIHDWNNKIKKGETTRLSSLIALKFYEWFMEKDIYFYHNDDTKEKIIQTILYGAFEVKEELLLIFNKVLENKWKHHLDPYYDLIQSILTKTFDSIEVYKALPEYILQLAYLYWYDHPKQEDDYLFLSRMDLEQYFGLDNNHFDYYPSSAYQTPIYWLLQVSLKNTVDFIISFTNKTVENYATSEFGKNEIQEVQVFITDEKSVKQYISSRIWNMYRGTSTAPNLLESIHMALEKFFLEAAKYSDSKTLESWLLYLLKNSKSASITAVVTSIVLAYPEKTFNVALVLFKTKEFFEYDTSRMVQDSGAKSLYSIGYGLNYKDNIHLNERIKTCEDEHRKKSLESLVLYYQVFKNSQISYKEIEMRQNAIWAILDKYYEEIKENEEIKSNKTWRLYLARMDSRKMNTTFEEIEDGILLEFNPELDSELKNYSEATQKEIERRMKYTSLKMWAIYKLEKNEQFKKYTKYEENPLVTLKEIEEIIHILSETKDYNFCLFNHSIPALVCSVLIRDHFQLLSLDERDYCKNIILATATSSFNDNYGYQIGDGVDACISVLPILLKEFPEEKEKIKITLLLTLFDDHPIGVNKKFSDYAIKAIQSTLWEVCPDDAESILLGYLILKPKYVELRKKIFGNYINSISKGKLLDRFVKENESYIQKVVENKVSFEDVPMIDDLDLSILLTAFSLMPLNVNKVEIKQFARSIIDTFAKVLLFRNRENRIDYNLEHTFIEKYALFVLSSSKEDIPKYLKPFLDFFNSSEPIADLFQEFIFIEDRIVAYDNFWQVWNLFYEKVVELVKDGDKQLYKEKIVKNYLFAHPYWNETAREWHSLKERDKVFFSKVVRDMGHCPSVLYSISKLLNYVGSIYLNNGITWISMMLKNNKNLWVEKLEVNTMYYLENLLKKYIYTNREKIKKVRKLKQEVLVILDFMVNKGSVVGYMLRENIL